MKYAWHGLALESPFEIIKKEKFKVSIVADVKYDEKLSNYVFELDFVRLQTIAGRLLVVPSDYVRPLLQIAPEALSMFLYRAFKDALMEPVREESDFDSSFELME